MKQELALVGGFGVAGFGPFVAMTVLSPLRDQPLGIPVVLLLLIVGIAAAGSLAGTMPAAAATLNSALWFNFLFVKPYGILKPAGVTRWPIVVVVLAGAVVVAATRRRQATTAAPTPDVPPPPLAGPPSRHIQRVARLIEQGVDERDLIAAVQIELTNLLRARSCRFEAEPDDAQLAATLTRLERNGAFSSTAGDTSRLEIPLPVGSRRRGRFLVDLNPGAAIPIDHRLVALIVVDHLAAAIESRDRATPNPHREIPWFPY